MRIFSPEQYLKDNMEIDCVNICIYKYHDRESSIFKGPGTITLNDDGSISYKVYNQNVINAEMLKYMQCRQQNVDFNKIACVFEGEDYGGIHWFGGSTVPQIPITALNSLHHVLVKGKIELLITQEDVYNECKKMFTELYYVKYPRLPYDGHVKITAQTETRVLATQFKQQNQTLDYNGSKIYFSEDLDNKYLKVIAEHADGFETPDVENWITQALMVATGKTMQPKIIIRHIDDSNMMLILGRPYIVYDSKLLSPFLDFQKKEEFWKFFMNYLLYCIQEKPLDNHPLTVGFIELSSASKSTLKNFMCILTTYIEFCIDKIFEEKKNKNKNIKIICDSVRNCNIPEEDQNLKDRALGLLSMLYGPQISSRMKQLVEKNIITKTQVDVWVTVRPKIAHGNILEFSNYNFDIDNKRHLICMGYRLIFQIIHYDGYALDYDGKDYQFVKFVSFKGIFKDI